MGPRGKGSRHQAGVTSAAGGRGNEANVLYMSSALPWRLYRIGTVRNGHYFN